MDNARRAAAALPCPGTCPKSRGPRRCLDVQLKRSRRSYLRQSRGGEERIRTSEGIPPADLQSAPFGRLGTSPDPLRV
jgi:hypothetical protein